MPVDYAKQLKQMGFSDDQIAQAKVGGQLLAEATAKPKEHKYGRYKSKWEALFATELDYLKAAGEILAWEYEPWSMKLTEARVVGSKTRPGVRFTPDFVVVLPDRRLRVVEVKGYQRNSSINRFKMAADRWPWFEWVMVTRKSGRWETIL